VTTEYDIDSRFVSPRTVLGNDSGLPESPDIQDLLVEEVRKG
jgi:hypothetical protein